MQILGSTASQILAFCFTLAFICAAPTISHADIGPKPTMHFTFMFAPDKPARIKSGTLLLCEESDCRDAKALDPLGPQNFTCGPESCDAKAYGFSPYAMIELVFTNGTTARSNVFDYVGFDARYDGTVSTEGIIINPKPINN